MRPGVLNRRRDHVQPERAADRFLIPLLMALAVMLLSRLAYFNAYRIETQALHHALAVLAGTVQFASVVFVALVVYPVAYFRGASGAERVVAGSTNLAVWVGFDTYSASAVFPWDVSLYYGVNIGSVLFAWNFALMGVLEVLCRWVSKREGSRINVLTPLPLIPVVLFALVVLGLSVEGGAAYFNMLLDGYLFLFRN
jgi:hypothetical protein